MKKIKDASDKKKGTDSIKYLMYRVSQKKVSVFDSI